MSCITENTIVIPSSTYKKFKEYAKKSNEVNGLVNVYKDYNISVFMFDSNDLAMKLLEDVDWISMETNYLDGDVLYTQIKDENGTYHSQTNMKTLLKQYIKNEKIYKNVCNIITYSDGR